MAPEVTIVVPSYNHARYVPECYRSVASQDFDDWEMVVVDDNSEDGSADVWRGLSDERVRVYENDRNRGTYGTLNRCVSLARGRLIAVLNSDDFWEPGKLSCQVEALAAQPDAAVCFTLGWRSDEEGRPNPDVDPHGDWPQGPSVRLLPYLLEQNRILASSVVFRREHAIFDESLRYSGDWVALIHACRGAPAACVGARQTRWRIHGASSHSVSEPVTLEEIRVRRAILQNPRRWLLPGEPAGLVWEKLGHCALHLSALCVLWNRPREARESAQFALRHARDKRAALKRWLGAMISLRVARRRMWPRHPEGFDGSRVASLNSIAWRFESA